MTREFEIASGSIIGSEHLRVGRNNQDGLQIRQDGDFTVLVVCDGCSSGSLGVSHNEVGAQLGAKIVAIEVMREMKAFGGLDLDWMSVRSAVLHSLRDILRCIGGAEKDQVMDSFLFTTVVAAISKEKAVFAAIGDGVVHVNDEKFTLGPFPRNEPPYIGYGLLPGSSVQNSHFKILTELPTDKLQNCFIGSDGCDDLANAWNRILPGGQLIGNISRLWTEDKFFRNPDAARRHLTLVNGGVFRQGTSHMKDDTTFISMRRKTNV